MPYIGLLSYCVNPPTLSSQAGPRGKGLMSRRREIVANFSYLTLVGVKEGPPNAIEASNNSVLAGVNAFRVLKIRPKPTA